MKRLEQKWMCKDKPLVIKPNKRLLSSHWVCNVLLLFNKGSPYFFRVYLNPYFVFGSPVTRFKLKWYNNYALVFFIRTRLRDILHNSYKTDLNNLSHLVIKVYNLVLGSGETQQNCCGWLGVQFGQIKIHLWL